MMSSYTMRNHHLKTLKAFFGKISEAKLTINLAKSEFCHVTLTFLGHAVGQRQVKKKVREKKSRDVCISTNNSVTLCTNQTR